MPNENLNVLMGRATNTDFKVNTEVAYQENLTLENLADEIANKNIALLIQRQNLAVNEMNLQIIDAEKKPTVSAGASYSFNYSDNPSQAFITNSNSRGLAANVGLNWTIFDGSRKLRKQNIMVNLTNQKNPN